MLDVTIHHAKDTADWLEFIGTVIKSIAWPVLIGAAVWYFREELREAFSKTTSIGVGNLIAQFDRGLKETEVLGTVVDASAEPGSTGTPVGEPAAPTKDQAGAIQPAQAAAPPVANEAKGGITPYDEWRKNFASSYAAAPGNSPAEKIVEAWKETEKLIDEVAARHGIPGGIPIAEKIEALGGMGIVNGAYTNLLRSQLNLRNLAANGGGFSELQARQFIERLEQHRSKLTELLS